MSFNRCFSPRTLLVVDLKTRKVVITRDENMNGGSSAAKITKPIYEMVKSGKAIMYYAHRPDDVRIPVEINGRYYAKPSKWVPKVKVVPVVPVVPVAPPMPKVRKFISVGGFRDGTNHLEWDGNKIICVMKDGRRNPSPSWSLATAEAYVKDGTVQEIV